MTDKNEIKITKNSTRDLLPCSFGPWRLGTFEALRLCDFATLRLFLPKSRRQKKRANQRLARLMDDPLCD
jgi:hypothetical protein